ncbi:hypothetical protein BT93_H0224 [Corymbia citriodora subsp. variegata]|nr:hypothetical protein BT93_H0224 [Corymbia citriodora subsp. variegata]
MESLAFEDLLDFGEFSEVVDEEDDLRKSSSKAVASLPDSASLDGSTPSLPEFPEEDLEWIMNKDSFPSLDSFEILTDQPGNIFKDDGLIPALENSSSSSTTTSANSTSNGGGATTIVSCCVGPRAPGRARSKRPRERRRGDFGVFAALTLLRGQEKANKKAKVGQAGSVKIGRKCLHCGSEKTPQWRAGPQGPKTLCNACGVRFKSGRLVPEYRPANSPTFTSELHSNSHRKIVEMRRMKQMGGGVKGVDMRVK